MERINVVLPGGGEAADSGGVAQEQRAFSEDGFSTYQVPDTKAIRARIKKGNPDLASIVT